MKLIAVVLVVLGLVVMQPHLFGVAQARDDDVARAVSRLEQQVRALSDQLRSLQDAMNRMVAHGPVALVDVPSDTSKDRANDICHRLGGQVQAYLQDPGAGRRLCRF